jgi:predicted HTH domain antitoxin
MRLELDIPDSVASGLRIPQGEVEPRLRTELAVALFAQGILPFGKSAELAAISRFAFAELLSRRGIARHYTESDLTDDLIYARGQ